MLINITSSNIGATPTETPGLIIKSEAAHLKIYDKGRKVFKAVNYSADCLVSFLNLTILHN